ncbi:MAG TPA: SWIM zinc finger family protein [Stellaceae bacterium]|nr:SWIM zinc finger family protein [Stellaceae bacterium]
MPVAERRRKAERMGAKLRRQGQALTPVAIAGRAIAATFWGKAWCDNIEAYSDFASRLPRGRTYVRNGSVFDLQIARGQVMALVSGSEVYRVALVIKELPAAKWRSICADCAAGIDSLVELLQGRLSKGIMERLCRQDGGLFPRPSDIRFSCSCPDHALLCKHVAAVLYGIGARLDSQPKLLFRLRGVDESELVAHSDAPAALVEKDLAADKVLRADDVSALFGLDMAEPAAEQPPAPGSRPRAGTRKPPRAPPPTVATGKTPAKADETAKLSAGGQTRPNRGAKVRVAGRAAERVKGTEEKARAPANAVGRVTRFRGSRRGASASRRNGRP